jgi:hypothetical protein
VRLFQGAVLVAKDGVPVLKRGHGFANAEFQAPNTPQTTFLIGSITKQFTATAILQLQEQGKLVVGDYELAPGFRLTFRTREGRLFTQAIGQAEFEVFAASETEYFLNAVDAQITFTVDAGVATGLVLHQNGQDVPAPKIR